MMGYFLDNFCEISYLPFRYTGTIITFQLDKYVAIIVLVIIVRSPKVTHVTYCSWFLSVVIVVYRPSCIVLKQNQIYI